MVEWPTGLRGMVAETQGAARHPASRWTKLIMSRPFFKAPETPEPVRAVAEQALREMDSTGRVDGSYQRGKDAERAWEP